MALDFPANPVNGQTYDNWTYSSSKGAWQATPFTPSATIVSPTKPLTASDGTVWFNTTDGTIFIYFNDGNSYQWVEVQANSALSSNIESRVATIEAAQLNPIKQNLQIISSNYAIPSGYNGMSAGPITIASGVTVTVPVGSAWSIV